MRNVLDKDYILPTINLIIVASHAYGLIDTELAAG